MGISSKVCSFLTRAKPDVRRKITSPHISILFFSIHNGKNFFSQISSKYDEHQGELISSHYFTQLSKGIKIFLYQSVCIRERHETNTKGYQTLNPSTFRPPNYEVTASIIFPGRHNIQLYFGLWNTFAGLMTDPLHGVTTSTC